MRLLAFLALRQVWARRGLHAIAVSGVTLGILALVTIAGIMEGSGEKFFSTILQVSPHMVVKSERADAGRGRDDDRTPHVTAFVTPPRAEERLRIQRPREMAAAMEEMPEIQAVAPFVTGTVIISAGARERAIELRAIEAAKEDLVTPLSHYVISGEYSGLSAASDGTMIGAALADDLGLKVGDRVLCSAQGRKTSLVVTTIFASGLMAVDRGAIFVNLRTGQSLLGRGDDIDGLDVRVHDPDHAREAATRVQRTFGYVAESWQETNASFLSLIDQQNVVVRMVLGALLLVGGFGILSIQVMIVGQKRRDIAILQSVGFRKKDILLVFLGQGILVAVLGSILGGAFGHLMLSWMRTWPASGSVFRAEFMPIKESFSIYGWATGFALLVGLTASLLPARRAAELQPVDILRGQT